ncbi:MAG: hypothetical protein KGL39_19745 [Patescibacteria group bacterium]|nr:hypothetical protein [Patescibacteria group bacterium]
MATVDSKDAAAWMDAKIELENKINSIREFCIDQLNKQISDGEKVAYKKVVVSIDGKPLKAYSWLKTSR